MDQTQFDSEVVRKFDELSGQDIYNNPNSKKFYWRLAESLVRDEFDVDEDIY